MRKKRARTLAQVEKARKSTYNLGPRVPPPHDHKGFRTTVLVALADCREPITVGDLWERMGGTGKAPVELHETLTALKFHCLVDGRETPDGERFELTAKGGVTR